MLNADPFNLWVPSDKTSVGDLSHGGSAVANMNDVMFSACLVGDFTKELPTDAQVESGHKLASWFLFNMPQYPNLNSWDQVKGQRVSADSLPGTDLERAGRFTL